MNRLRLTLQIYQTFESSTSAPLQTYITLLDGLEATYTSPPTVQYRRTMINPLTNLITSALNSEMHAQAVTLVYRLLTALGFSFHSGGTTGSGAPGSDGNSTKGDKRFEILQWGFLIDEIVVSLVDLCDAYGRLGMKGLQKDAEREARKAYLIMCGEDVSFDNAYKGRLGP